MPTRPREPGEVVAAGLFVVTTTAPSEADADRIAEAAVRERLAACAQVQGPIRSTFWWRGSLEHGTEWYCHLKTTGARLEALESLIAGLHPYEVPEIIATPIVEGHLPYLTWLEQEVRSETQEERKEKREGRM
jgi:periplasmic divalent cation tolerance protein